jgi:hypothetical protein
LQIQYNKEAKISLVPAIWVEFDKLEGKEGAKPHQERDFMENAYWQGLDSFISPNKRNIQNEIKTHLEKGNVEEAIRILLDYSKYNQVEWADDISLHSARFNKNERDFHKEIISQAEYKLEWSKINNAILSILEVFYCSLLAVCGTQTASATL